METVVHIALTPADGARVTPIELLIDFADASPDWQYLEAASDHYADEKDAPACILRHRHAALQYVDVAFCASDPDVLTDVELVLVDAPSPERALSLEERNDVVDAFLREMHEYLRGRPDHAELQVEKESVDPDRVPRAKK
jgi:hypothetical protein